MNSNLRPQPDDRVVLIYHKSDFDGRCSAAIAVRFYRMFLSFMNIELVPVEHGNDKINFKDYTDKIVVMMDYAFDPTLMYRINGVAKQFHWIDHHTTAIKDVEEFLSANLGFHPLQGLQDTSNSMGACGLTYRYFFDEKIPLPIKLLAQFDVCEDIYSEKNHPLMLHFQYGLRSRITTDPRNQVWQELVRSSLVDLSNVNPNSTDGEFLDSICHAGEPVVKYVETQSRELTNQYAQVVSLTIDGKLISDDVLLINDGLANPILVNPLMKKHEFVSIFTYRVGIGYKVSLYSYKRHAGKVCQLLGGGGHQRAAGFRCKELPYTVKEK